MLRLVDRREGEPYGHLMAPEHHEAALLGGQAQALPPSPVAGDPPKALEMLGEPAADRCRAADDVPTAAEPYKLGHHGEEQAGDTGPPLPLGGVRDEAQVLVDTPTGARRLGYLTA